MPKIRHGWAGGLFVAALLIMLPSSARADAGIPMMPVRYPELTLFLFPVIIIEAIYLKRHLQTRWRRTLVAVTLINLVTMGLGYPLAYGVYMLLNWALQFPAGMNVVFTHMGWLPLWLCTRLFPAWSGLGAEGAEQGSWPVLGMFVVLMLPSFVLTGIVKAWMVSNYDLLNFRGSAGKAVWVANRLSYLFLVVVGCMILYLTYTRSPIQ
ncbi:MAG: hypothetical protein WA414_02460 [Acidobacteriaceae bacterium]|jgi:hypothetical protein